jgi:hypothetical protein
VRPTDEHQTPSTRPNFMSAKSRPSAGGDNILARLDRGGAGTARTPWSPGAKVAAVGGGLATLALLWLLISITQENLQERRDMQAVTATPTVLEPASQAQSEAPAESQAEARVSSQASAHTETQASAHSDAQTEKRADSPVDVNSLEPIPVLPMLADVVEKAPAAPAAPVAQAVTPAPRAAPRSVRPHTAPRATASHAGVPRPAQEKPAKVADAAIDSDVALLSAILMHAPRHSAERARAEAKCKDDKKCTVSPLPALIKATE